MSRVFPGHHRPNPRGDTTPLVEAISKHHGEWTIVDRPNGPGGTDNTGRKMFIPMDDEPCRCGGQHNASVRSHELIHSKLSPAKKEGIQVKVDGEMVDVDVANVEVAEEFRVNTALVIMEHLRSPHGLICPLDVQSAVSSLMDRKQYQDVIRYSIACGPGKGHMVVEALSEYQRTLTKSYHDASVSGGKVAMGKFLDRQNRVATLLKDNLDEFDHVAQRIMRGSTYGKGDNILPGWSATAQLAAFLQVNLDDLTDKLDELLNPEEIPPDLSELLYEEDYPEEGLQVPLLDKDGNLEVPGRDLDKTGAVEWGDVVDITEAVMTRPLPPWKLQRANRAVDEGTIPRYMHRWPSDKRVFHRTKRLPGGTVLVDSSGSMGLSTEDLDRILETVPVATVAIYAGYFEGSGGGGEVRVVARDGKRADEDDLEFEFGENVIDGPALEWLGEQPYPRIWISDGGVSDRHGDFGSRVRKDAAKIVVRNKITMVGDAEAAAHVLKTKTYAR